MYYAGKETRMQMGPHVPRVQEGFPGAYTKVMMRVLQLNLNHSAAAKDLLMQNVCKEKIDVAIIAEQYRVHDKSSYKTDASR